MITSQFRILFCVYLTLLFLCFSLFNADTAVAQARKDSVNHASTYDWTYHNRLQILDRSHAFGDERYDRGAFRVLTPLVKREYELDVFTQEFSFMDVYHWHHRDTGFRSRAGSFSKSRWAVFSEIRTIASLSERSRFRINGYQQQHPRANRALFEFEYQQDLSTNSSLGLSHTLSEFKKDLDVTVSYYIKTQSAGSFSLQLTFQDYLNNVVNEAGNDTEPLNPSREQFETVNKRIPLFLLGRWQSVSSHWLNVDFSAGLQPETHSENVERTTANFKFDEFERIAFLNFSSNIQFFNSVFGLFAYADHSYLKRSGSGNPLDGFYTSKQSTRRFGFYFYGNYDWLKPSLKVSRDFYSDTQKGSDVSFSLVPEEFDYDESRWLLDAGLSIEPFSFPLFITSRYLLLSRDQIDIPESGLITRQWTDQFFFVITKDHRISFSLGYQAHSRVFVELGGAYDLDKDVHNFDDVSPQTFDKGYGRLIVDF